MGRIFEQIVKYVILFIMVVAIGIGIFLWTFDLNQYKGMIVKKTSEVLGRPVSIGELSLKLSFIPTVSVKDLVIGNPEGFQEDMPFLKVNSMDVTLAVPPLIQQRRVDMKEFALGKAEVNLIELENGRNNWTFNMSSKSEEGSDADESAKESVQVKEQEASETGLLPAGLTNLDVDAISIQQLSIILTQGEKRTAGAVSDFSMQQLRVFSGRFYYNGYSASVNGVMNRLTDLLMFKPDYAFELNIQALQSTFKLSGSIGDVKAFKNFVFDVSAQGRDLVTTYSSAFEQKLNENMAVLGGAYSFNAIIQGDMASLDIPKLNVSVAGTQLTFDGRMKLKNPIDDPVADVDGTITLKQGSISERFGIRPLSVSAQVTASSRQIDIKHLAFLANKTDIDLSGRIELKQPRPFVQLDMASEYFNMDDLINMPLADVSNGTADTASSEGNKNLFPDTPIDMSALKAIDADVSVSLGYIRVPATFGQYAAVTAKALLTNGMLEVDLTRGLIFDGSFSGHINVASSDIPQINVDISLNDLNTDALKEVASFIKDARVNGVVRVNAQGDTIRALAGSLDGLVTLEMSEAQIVSRDFNQLLKTANLFPESTKNDFAYSEADVENKLICAAAGLNFKNGRAELNRQIALETSLVNFAVSGNIDLKEETLSVSITPSLGYSNSKVDKILQLTQSVVISGPFNNLMIDTKQTAQNIVQNAVQGVLEQLVEKKTGQKESSDALAPGSLCAIALGRPVSIKTPEKDTKQVVNTSGVSAIASVLATASEKNESDVSKEQLKRQLFNTLSDVLKKK